MPEHRTDLVIAAKTKGFQDAQRQATKLVQDSADSLKNQTRGFSDMQKSVKTVDREVGKLEGTLQKLVVKQLELTDAMEGIGDKASPAYKSIAKQLKGVNQEATSVERTISRLDRAFNRQEQNQRRQEQNQRRQEQKQRQMMAGGAFTQGLIQGASPNSMFLQRGPGMMRQTAGMATGRAARGIAGGLMSTPTTGFGGLTSAAGAIPVIGGAVAGQMQAVSGMAQQGLNLQRQRLGMIPLLGGGGGRALSNLRNARARGEAGPIAPVKIDEKVLGVAREKATQTIMGELGTGDEGLRRNYAETGYDLKRRRKLLEFDYTQEEVGRITQERRKQGGARAAARAKAQLFAPTRRAGKRFMGVNQQQSMQTAGAMLQSGGGSLKDLQGQGLLDTGFAAQTAYGVGPEISGAFLQAGRRGGLSGLAPGTPGGGGDALTSSIADAMKLGLEGSEVNNYLQTMAEGISQWRQTGIPFAKDAIADFGSELGRLGIGGVRGSAIAGGVAGAAQRLSRGGPQTAQELLMMQTMGGLTPGSGAAGFEEAQIKLEQLKGGGTKGPEFTKLLEQLMGAGGGGASGRLFARQSLGQMGVTIGAEEMQLMGKQIQEEGLTETQQKRLKEIQTKRVKAAKGAPGSPEQIQNMAAEMLKTFGSGLKTAADIQDKQMKIGEDMVPILEDLNQANIIIAEAFKNLAKGPLKTLTGVVLELTDAIAGKKKEGPFGRYIGVFCCTMTEEKQNSPGFQGSETSGAEVVIYTQEYDPVIFVGSLRERDPLIRVNGRKRQEVNPSLVSVSTSKEMGSPSGKWQAIIKPSGMSDNIFNRLLDNDWVDITFTRHGRKWHTMRGLIDDVRKTTTVSGTGATTTSYLLTGRDFGKIFETTPIWFSIFSDDAISGGVSYKVFGGQTNIQGSPGQTVRGFLDGFLIELAGSGRALWQLPSSMPGHRAETFVQSIKFNFDKFSNDPARTGLNPNFLMPQGTVWEMAQEWSDPLFHELFVDTLPVNPQANEYTNEDTQFTVVFRDRPLPSIDDGPKGKTGKDGPWYSLPMHVIPIQAVVSMDVGRSGLDRCNAFFVAPQIAQESVKAGAIDLHGPLWSKDDILRHGLRRFDVTSKYTSLNAEILTLSSRLRTRIRDWYCINAYLLNGNISFGVGLPYIRIGDRLKIPSSRGPDFDHTYYVESVSHEWTFGQGLKTSTGVTRGWIGTEDSYLEALEVLIVQYSVPNKKDPDNA